MTDDNLLFLRTLLIITACGVLTALGMALTGVGPQ